MGDGRTTHAFNATQQKLLKNPTNESLVYDSTPTIRIYEKNGKSKQTYTLEIVPLEINSFMHKITFDSEFTGDDPPKRITRKLILNTFVNQLVFILYFPQCTYFIIQSYSTTHLAQVLLPQHTKPTHLQKQKCKIYPRLGRHFKI